ncbi:hypothetical protein [Streptomyces triticiradicis]|nr:hypothetical protein [Streptomyces triticiradicis]
MPVSSLAYASRLEHLREQYGPVLFAKSHRQLAAVAVDLAEELLTCSSP